MRSEWAQETLMHAIEALRNEKPILSANLWAIKDQLAEEVSTDACLHYDVAPDWKMKGELVCGECRVMFGYWREPPIQVTVTRA